MKWDTRIADHEGGRPRRDGQDTPAGRRKLSRGAPTPPDAIPEGVQLLCADRVADEAARISRAPRRGDRGSRTDRFLLDTIGELRAAYGLADLVVVGRTFVDLGGSDMIEPVALGRPTIIGPDTTHFQVIAGDLEEAGGLRRCGPDELGDAIRSMPIADPEAAAGMARGRRLIRDRQGDRPRRSSSKARTAFHDRRGNLRVTTPDHEAGGGPIAETDSTPGSAPAAPNCRQACSSGSGTTWAWSTIRDRC